MPSASRTDGSTLTVAIVGAGQVGQRHGQAFAQLSPDVCVAGVADVDEGRAAELAATCGARAFTDYRALLELGPDITVICLPHHLHREAGLAAAAAGIHILMEKPLAHTLEDAHAIVDGCRQHGVRLAVGFLSTAIVSSFSGHVNSSPVARLGPRLWPPTSLGYRAALMYLVGSGKSAIRAVGS